MTTSEQDKQQVEMIIKILSKNSCLTPEEITTRLYRFYGVEITPQKTSGLLRKKELQYKLGSSNCGNGKKVYWVLDEYVVKENV